MMQFHEFKAAWDAAFAKHHTENPDTHFLSTLHEVMTQMTAVEPQPGTPPVREKK
jgi:hypothetical protein